jgi:hypothetical protein
MSYTVVGIISVVKPVKFQHCIVYMSLKGNKILAESLTMHCSFPKILV